MARGRAQMMVGIPAFRRAPFRRIGLGASTRARSGSPIAIAETRCAAGHRRCVRLALDQARPLEAQSALPGDRRVCQPGCGASRRAARRLRSSPYRAEIPPSNEACAARFLDGVPRYPRNPSLHPIRLSPVAPRDSFQPFLREHDGGPLDWRLPRGFPRWRTFIICAARGGRRTWASSKAGLRSPAI